MFFISVNNVTQHIRTSRIFLVAMAGIFSTSMLASSSTLARTRIDPVQRTSAKVIKAADLFTGTVCKDVEILEKDKKNGAATLGKDIYEEKYTYVYEDTRAGKEGQMLDVPIRKENKNFVPLPQQIDAVLWLKSEQAKTSPKKFPTPTVMQFLPEDFIQDLLVATSIYQNPAAPFGKSNVPERFVFATTESLPKFDGCYFEGIEGLGALVQANPNAAGKTLADTASAWGWFPIGEVRAKSFWIDLTKHTTPMSDEPVLDWRISPATVFWPASDTASAPKTPPKVIFVEEHQAVNARGLYRDYIRHVIFLDKNNQAERILSMNTTPTEPSPFIKPEDAVGNDDNKHVSYKYVRLQRDTASQKIKGFSALSVSSWSGTTPADEYNEGWGVLSYAKVVDPVAVTPKNP